MQMSFHGPSHLGKFWMYVELLHLTQIWFLYFFKSEPGSIPTQRCWLYPQSWQFPFLSSLESLRSIPVAGPAQATRTDLRALTPMMPRVTDCPKPMKLFLIVRCIPKLMLEASPAIPSWLTVWEVTPPHTQAHTSMPAKWSLYCHAGDISVVLLTWKLCWQQVQQLTEQDVGPKRYLELIAKGWLVGREGCCGAARPATAWTACLPREDLLWI